MVRASFKIVSRIVRRSSKTDQERIFVVNLNWRKTLGKLFQET